MSPRVLDHQGGLLGGPQVIGQDLGHSCVTLSTCKGAVMEVRAWPLYAAPRLPRDPLPSAIWTVDPKPWAKSTYLCLLSHLSWVFCMETPAKISLKGVWPSEP